MALVVYKSSAGSGKTTTLVNEYLKITLRQPHQFSHVLAVTFTNNAANEMKSRILESLEKISAGLAWEEGELQDVLSDLGMEREEIVTKASELLKLIIHRYDEFAISTIDSFVHRIIRTFATDVQLPQNFEVVIDKDDFVPDIVDDLFSKVGHDKALTDILVRFVLAQTEEERSYDPGRMITTFVEKQLDEEGFEHVEQLAKMDAETFISVINRMFTQLQVQKEIIRSLGQEALGLLEENRILVKN